MPKVWFLRQSKQPWLVCRKQDFPKIFSGLRSAGAFDQKASAFSFVQLQKGYSK